MLDLIIATALAQTAAQPTRDPCHAADPGARPAGCVQWRAVARDERSELFVDSASVRRNGTAFDIATRIVFAEPQEEEGMRSGVTISRFDCTARTWSLRHSAYYDGDGNVIVEGDVTGDEAAPQPIPPGPLADLLTEFCPR
jgi:hypothetical protein